MAFNGSGAYNRVMNWVTDRNNGITIQASRMDTEFDDIATALSLCLLKDGQQTPTANIGWGGFKLTNLGDATNATDAMNRQVGDARYIEIDGTSVTSALIPFAVGASFGASIRPATHDVAALGTTALRFSDAFFASGAVISFGAASTDDVTITHSANALAFAGASSGYSFDAAILPATSDAAALGSATLMFSDAFMASGAVINFNNGNITLTHSLGDLALAGGTLTLPNTGLHLLDTNASHDLIIKPGSDLTADHTLTLTTGDADRTISLAGNVTLAGALTTAAAFITSGANSLTLTTTGVTDVTLPTTGTLAILGANTFTADQTITSTDAGSLAGPTLDLYRDSASPAASDNIGQVTFSGRDSASNKQEFAAINAFISDPTSASEDSVLGYKTTLAGVYDVRLKLGAGLYTNNATGGDPGVDKFNASDYQIDGVSLKRLFKNLSATDTGSNVNTAQPWFPTAGAITLTANKTYRFEGLLWMSRAAGTTSHTTSLLFGGTATVTSITGMAIANSGDTGANENVNRTQIFQTAATVVKAASTSATEQTTVRVSGTVRITTGGTLIPQFQYSAAPGGAPTIQIGTFFELTEIGADTVTTRGTWA